MQIIAATVDLSGYGRQEREVVARIIHSCADPSIAETILISPGAIPAAIAALQSESAVITDVEMVRSALYAPSPLCMLAQVPSAQKNKTRTQLGIELAARSRPSRSIFVVGCAPTALATIIELAQSHAIDPAAVIALPVGYVGASEAKDALAKSGISSITNRGGRGGSAMTAAAFNAIARMAAGIYSFEAAIGATEFSDVTSKNAI